jgi:hypothetical protein
VEHDGLLVALTERGRVPLTHRLVARNWNLASSGVALTTPSVAKSVGVSTPLSG